MKKSIFLSTLLTAAALSVPAFADGSGTQSDPYTGTCDGLNIFDSSTWPAGSTVYIDGITSGYFISGNDTCVADVNIGSKGMTFSNGYQAATYLFTGNISGTGNWTFSNSGTARQDCTFTGSLADYSGNISITSGTGTENEDYFRFGNGGQAATDTNVSGTGSITITNTSGLGEITFNYGSYASETSTAITIGNSSLTASEITFTGSVNYVVNSTISGNSGASSTLTISNTEYTTTLNGTVSGINVTVSSGATLAVGSTGSLNLSGATVDLASTIQNSGTVTIDSSTVFVLDNLTPTSGNVTSDEGATYTLITGSSGSVTVDTTLLGTSNVSSVHDITSATFNYADGVLTVTVIELSDGLHGNGTIESPYYTSGSGKVEITDSGDGNIFTASGTTLYLATDEHSFGNSSENVYLNGTLTAECNIVIGKAGVYLTNATSSQYYNFTGAISGEGSWTHGREGSTGSPALHYAFAGDLSGWSGDFTITYSNANDIVIFGGTINGVSNDAITGVTGVVAVTGTNVSGTGAISVGTGTVQFNYVKPEEGATTGYDTVTIGNSSITAATLTFAGDVTYSVDLSKTTLSATTLNVGEKATLLISGSGTLTESGDSYSLAVSGTLELAESVTLTIAKNIAASVSVENLVLGNGSTLDLSTNAATGTSSKNTSIGTVTIASSTGASSATITTDNWEDYVTIGAIVGSGTLILDAKGSMDHVTVYELTGTGTSSFTGTIDLTSTNSSTSAARGISLVISDASVAAGAVIDMGTENSYYSAIALGVNASTVEIAGLVSTSSTGGDIVYSGAVSAGAQLGNAGATLIDYKGQSNYGSGSNFDNVGTSRNTLVINVAENATYSFSGVIMDMLNLEKTGAGTQSITFQTSQYGSTGYYFDGTIAVKGGTLNLSGVETNSSGITVAEGATLNIANHITLATTSDITSVTSTISGTLSIESGGQLDLTGTVTINSAISNSGTITIADGTSITVGVTMQTGEYSGTNYDYYTLIDGSNGSGSVTLGESVTFVINGAEITLSEIATLADGDTDWKGYISGGSLYIYAETSTTAETADPLYWAGTEGNSTWSTSEDNTPWSATDGGEAGLYFADEANVIFGASAESKTVAVVGEVAPGSITVNGEYTFAIGEEASVKTGALTYGDGGSLTLTGTGSFIFDGETTSTDFTISTSDEFTGTLEVAKGLLDLSKVSLGTSTKLVIDAIGDPDTNGAYTTSNSNAILFDATNNTLANDLTIAGSSGGVILRSAGTEITLSGSVTGDDGTTLQLNGNGTANFTGKVSLSNYINYQGATVFKNETTLGSLEIYQAESNKGDVTFTGSAAKATVTALTIAQTGGSGTATLTVSDGASLEVANLVVNHDVAIAIDSAAMSITTSVTQASGTSTSVTISNGGTLSLGSDVSLNVDVMNIVLGEANYDEGNSGSGTFAIVGDTGSSLTLTDSALITITVSEAIASLLSQEGTYSFNIYEGLSLSTDVFDIQDILNYSTDVTWSNGVLTVVVGSGAIPEPELFSIFFGLGAIGLVATRRRRRKAA